MNSIQEFFFAIYIVGIRLEHDFLVVLNNPNDVFQHENCSISHCSGGEIGAYSTETLPGHLGWWRCRWLSSKAGSDFTNEECIDFLCGNMPSVDEPRSWQASWAINSHDMFQIIFDRDTYSIWVFLVSGTAFMHPLLPRLALQCRRFVQQSYSAIQCFRRHCFVSEKNMWRLETYIPRILEYPKFVQRTIRMKNHPRTGLLSSATDAWSVVP